MAANDELDWNKGTFEYIQRNFEVEPQKTVIDSIKNFSLFLK